MVCGWFVGWLVGGSWFVVCVVSWLCVLLVGWLCVLLVGGPHAVRQRMQPQ